jgi:nicotinamidase-related amidase
VVRVVIDNLVVESTARHATDLGFQVTTVKDCCDFATERILPMFSVLASSDEAIAQMKGNKS